MRRACVAYERSLLVPPGTEGVILDTGPVAHAKSGRTAPSFSYSSRNAGRRSAARRARRPFVGAQRSVEDLQARPGEPAEQLGREQAAEGPPDRVIAVRGDELGRVLDVEPGRAVGPVAQDEPVALCGLGDHLG